MNNQQLQEQAKEFLHRVFQHINREKIDLKNWEIDHLCYRTSSQENYLNIKKKFEKLGHLLTESQVNGRPIATYKLHIPIVFKKWTINLIEVPAPKLAKYTEEGFEHFEVVIDESFIEIEGRYPNIIFNKKGTNKDLNPELEIEFQDCAIKFHHNSLERIIQIEKGQK